MSETFAICVKLQICEGLILGSAAFMFRKIFVISIVPQFSCNSTIRVLIIVFYLFVFPCYPL